jgi:death on curing protein
VSEADYLDLEDLLRLTRVLRGGPVRDIGLLAAACARSQATALGEQAYPSLDLKAAALLHSLVRNHALVDGNERLAWLATVVFCDLNGDTVELGDDAALELVMAAAEGQLDVEQIAHRLALRPH